MVENIYYPIGVWAFSIYWLWSEYKKDRNNESLMPVEKYGCPHCNSEYQSHIEICSDCNNQLAFYIEELNYSPHRITAVYLLVRKC